MRALLRRDPRFRVGQRKVQSYFESVEKYTRRSLKQTVDNSSMTSLRPCNSDGFISFFKRAYEVYNEIRRLPQLDTSCLSEYIITSDVESNLMGLSLTQLSQAVRERSKSVFKNRERIADVVLGNWTKPDAPYDYEYNKTSLVCTVNNVAGIRVGPKWYLRTVVTNRPAMENVPLFFRKILYEFIRTGLKPDDLDESLRLSTYVRPPNGTGFHRLEKNTTTLLEARQGSHLPTSYGRMYFELMPAVPAAVELAEHGQQQVSDALAPSSISILILPMMLNLVPLGALSPAALLSSTSTFIYTLLTDVSTVIPLIIKGVELIVIGKQRHTAAAVRMSSAIDGSLASSSVAELWTAECRVHVYSLRMGVAFVVLGVVSMVIGVGLELFTLARVKKRMRVEGMRHMVDHKVELGERVRVGDLEEYDNSWGDKVPKGQEGKSEGGGRVFMGGAVFGDSPPRLLSASCDLLESSGKDGGNKDGHTVT